MSSAKLKTCYRKVTAPFGEKGEFYDNYGHRGADYVAFKGDPVYAYEDGAIGYIGKSGNLGGVVGMKCANHYAGWAHIIPAKDLFNGKQIKAGHIIGFVAGYGDDEWHGELWDGAHIHTTASLESSYNAALGVRPLVDPVPYINGAVFTPKDIAKEVDMSKQYVGLFVSESGSIHSDPKKRWGVVISPESGFYTAFSGQPQDYYNEMARVFNTRPFAGITQQQWNTMKKQLDEMRAVK